MSRRQLNPLRPLTERERTWLTRLSRSSRAPAGEVARAKTLLAVAAVRTRASGFSRRPSRP